MHLASLILVYLVISATGSRLMNTKETLPRTEVLEIVVPNWNEIQAEPQKNGTISVTRNNETNICITKGCVKASALILDLLDETIDPCDDFYEFACGKFIRNTFIPDDKIAMMSFVHVQDKVLGQLRLILNEKSLPNESKAFTLAKTFNAACMDQETLENKGQWIGIIGCFFSFLGTGLFFFEIGIQPMVDILKKYGNWPVVEGSNWKEDNWEWMAANRNISNDGLDDTLLFSLVVLTDQRNSSKRVLDVSLYFLHFFQTDFILFTTKIDFNSFCIA